MDSHSKIVLITGINGFTGKYLNKYLSDKNYTVYGISNQKEHCNSFIFHCDISNSKKLKEVINQIKPNYIFHLAAISFVQHENIAEIYKTNILGTQNLLNACLDIKNYLKKIVLASSASVYGQQNVNILSEDLCPNPNNHYALSKYAMEQVAKTYFSELSIIITRPFNYTAPGHGEQFVIPKIAKAFKNKESQLKLGNLDVFREYNSIEYVCNIYYQLMMSKLSSDIVNIASEKEHSLNEIIKLFTEKSKHNIKIQVDSDFIRKNEVKSLKGSTKKLFSIVEKSTMKSNSIENVIESFLV
jgi:GDP-6-deoxy-D-talose 4-dehydrogenase